MYKCKYFKLNELLPPELYVNEDKGWELFDEKLLKTIDLVREWVGNPLIANNWRRGGSWKYRGARTTKSKDYRFGSYHSVRPDRPVMALDFHCEKVRAEAIRALLGWRAAELPYPIRLERGVSWVHLDVAEKKGYKVYLFNA